MNSVDLGQFPAVSGGFLMIGFQMAFDVDRRCRAVGGGNQERLAGRRLCGCKRGKDMSDKPATTRMLFDQEDAATRLAAYPYGKDPGNESIKRTREAFKTRILETIALSNQEFLERLIRILNAEFSLDDEGNAPNPNFVRGIKYCVAVLDGFRTL